ncbi:Hypothetical predicted protein [Cloeon dipterum]|uniref:Peptidase S1 domain-containing protein n=1 Tax=Cloeon dipterum TaxID=197152 RepID=A0A8S1DGR7_9INSE|nr:Hypothetical predicted protein [Cloeon dipterum]
MKTVIALCIILVVAAQAVDWRKIQSKRNAISRGLFQAVILINPGRQNSICGGSLIKNDKVLTAAHCCLGGTSFEIHLGTNNEKVVRSERTTVHEHYNQSSYANDICIIHLDEEVSGEGIATIRLPSRSRCSATFEKRKATVSGWGLTSKNETTMKVELMHADVIIMHSDFCRKIYEQFTAETLCAASSSIECFVRVIRFFWLNKI